MKLAIYGAGGMGGTILNLALQINKAAHRWDEIMFADDVQEPGYLFDCAVRSFLETSSLYAPDEVEFSISVGEPQSRKIMAERLEAAGYHLATLIHPTHPPLPMGVVLEDGVIILSPSIGLGHSAHIGKNTLLQSYCAVGHEAVVGCNSNISCFALVSGKCRIGDNVFIGIQAVVKEKITIGNNAIVGMCAPVFRDVPDNYTVFHAVSKMAPSDPDARVFH